MNKWKYVLAAWGLGCALVAGAARADGVAVVPFMGTNVAGVGVITGVENSVGIFLGNAKYKTYEGALAVYWDASALSNNLASLLQYELSPDGTNWVGTSNIVSAFSNNAGRTANGKDLFQLPPLVAPWVRFKTTLTLINATNPVATNTVSGPPRGKLFIR